MPADALCREVQGRYLRYAIDEIFDTIESLEAISNISSPSSKGIKRVLGKE